MKNSDAAAAVVEIEYPCVWQYKAIGRSRDLLLESIEAVFCGESCEVTYSNSSRSGKYHSYTVELEVADEDSRNRFYMGLKNSAHVVMVI